jgi:c-di-GMP-binding flagellar brake protein YcgR
MRGYSVAEINDKRKYVRLNTVFPVEFNIVNDNKETVSPLVQGFTRNVGRGGMCIEVKVEKDKDSVNFIPEKTKVKLIINIPSNSFATDSYATVRWVKKIPEYILDTYIFGVEYDEIETDNQRMIERHVRWIHMRPKVISAFVLILFFIVLLLTYIGLKAR